MTLLERGAYLRHLVDHPARALGGLGRLAPGVLDLADRELAR